MTEDGLERVITTGEQLQDRAADRLRDIYQEQGGDEWMDDEPRKHFYKAVDEFTDAKTFEKLGEIELMDKCIEDGLNHISIAAELADSHTDTGLRNEL